MVLQQYNTVGILELVFNILESFLKIMNVDGLI